MLWWFNAAAGERRTTRERHSNSWSVSPHSVHRYLVRKCLKRQCRAIIGQLFEKQASLPNTLCFHYSLVVKNENLACILHRCCVSNHATLLSVKKIFTTSRAQLAQLLQRGVKKRSNKQNFDVGFNEGKALNNMTLLAWFARIHS